MGGMTVRQKPKFSVAIQTDGYQKLINNTLGDPERAKRFVASITSAVAVNPALQDCDAGTVLAGALLGESLNLSPSPQLGQYYLVPFKVRVKDADGRVVYKTDENGNKLKDDKGHWIAETETKASFVLGYKGYLQLAIRSGQYADIDVMEVKAGEYLGKDKFSGKPKFEFVEDDDERDELQVIGYMAYFEYLNGFKKTLYWSKQKMLKHADKYSAAFNAADYEKFINGEVAEKDMWKYSSYWYQDFDGMAKKTMLRQLISKWGVMSIEMQSAITKDDSFANASGGEVVASGADDIVTVDAADVQPEYVGAVSQVNLADL
ncbi:MAG: recombinase RecT [Oscillospiraceae bacterium]|nr:recombinase RecT [Oscillospiraceae bacterium]